MLDLRPIHGIFSLACFERKSPKERNMAKAKSTTVYQLKITLKGSKPPIWRRIHVADDTTLDDLHWIVQETMGWYNCHLHQFFIDGEYYSDPEMEIDEALDETKFK